VSHCLFLLIISIFLKHHYIIFLNKIDLTRTWEILGEITGDTVHESLIDQLFSQFCLGK
ncbi:hypothetical protein ACT4UT_00630, partial [Bacillus sp. B-TM1]